LMPFCFVTFYPCNQCISSYDIQSITPTFWVHSDQNDTMGQPVLNVQETSQQSQPKVWWICRGNPWFVQMTILLLAVSKDSCGMCLWWRATPGFYWGDIPEFLSSPFNDWFLIPKLPSADCALKHWICRGGQSRP
jgi:hypothetical protein